MSLIDFIEDTLQPGSIFTKAISVISNVGGMLTFSNGEKAPEDNLGSHPDAQSLKDTIKMWLASHIDIPFVTGDNEKKVEDGIQLIAEGLFNQLLHPLATNAMPTP